MKLECRYEDQHLIALNKPSGLPSQPLASAPSGPSAGGYAKLSFPEIASAGPDPLEGGLLHRLDVGTSGVLLFARDRPTYDRLKGQWKLPGVRKYYRAIVCGSPQFSSLPHLIDIPLGRSAKSSSRMLAFTHPEMQRRIRGKPLEARTWVEATLGCARPVSQDSEALTDLHLRIETGVMHQIRCHLSHLGTPILGDSRYKGSPSSRLWLHAWKIEIAAEILGRAISIEAPIPSDWPLGKN